MHSSFLIYLHSAVTKGLHGLNALLTETEQPKADIETVAVDGRGGKYR